jgi:hypothetical protein
VHMHHGLFRSVTYFGPARRQEIAQQEQAKCIGNPTHR